MLQTSRSRLRDKTKGFGDPTPSAKIEPGPRLTIAKIGIVSRDYNKLRDFRNAFPDVLTLLDRKGCDTVLFSLYSIDFSKLKSFKPFRSIRLRHVKAVLYEEGGKGEKNRQCVVFYRRGHKWHRYVVPGGGFPTLKGLTDKKKREKVGKFVERSIPGRTLGNCCVILCGEINGVPYHMDTKEVRDDFGLRKSLPRKAIVVLNPGHDRMTRFEMKLKRSFFSEQGRWTISVWNKGKQDKKRRTHDGTKPPWTVFHNGHEVTQVVGRLQTQIQNLEIGILEIAE
jgi:hypothetical protein